MRRAGTGSVPGVRVVGRSTFPGDHAVTPLADRAFSSGAALRGSPLSGGYAGAKATIGFITSYAADESERAALGIRFTSVLPQLTPATDLGAAATAAYAARQGVDVATFLAGSGPALTPEQVGKAVADIAADPGHDHDAYLLTAADLTPVR
jgi:hypothetical protein